MPLNSLHDCARKMPLAKERLAFVLLLLIAFQFRVVNLIEVSDSPHFTIHQLDPLYYHQKAMNLVQTGQLGGHFSMSPLFTLVLAGLYKLFGPNPYPIRILHLFLGVMSVGLIFFIGRRIGGRMAGWIAGIAACFYAPFIFFEELLCPDTLLVFLNTLGLFFLVGLDKTSPPTKFILPGVCLGLAAITRANNLLAILFVLAWFLFTARWDFKGRFVRVSVLFLATFAVMAPITVINYIHSRSFIAVTDTGGMNFYIGNNHRAIGTFQVPAEIPQAASLARQFLFFREYAQQVTKRSLSPSEVDQFWYQKAGQEIIKSPWRWGRLLIKKVVLFFNYFEIPNFRNYYYSQRFSWILRLPLFEFWMLSPLALFGCLIGLAQKNRRRQNFFLLGLFFTYLLGVVLFFVVDRYRLPLVPYVILWAAISLQWGWLTFQKRAFRLLSTSLVLIILIGLAIRIPIITKGFEQARWDHALALHLQGKETEAAKLYLELVKADPNHLQAHQNLAVISENHQFLDHALHHWRAVHRIALETRDLKALNLANERINTLIKPR